ncbi:MAG: hypothetical protein JRJ39_01590 [Deltaproteobacteria bacterium]|nr:hypothetical protein [Deltaproteobacteria bacterium]MBW1848660.1 hypothetical protein [Deltaproteobacteria bacterium]
MNWIIGDKGERRENETRIDTVFNHRIRGEAQRGVWLLIEKYFFNQ